MKVLISILVVSLVMLVIINSGKKEGFSDRMPLMNLCGLPNNYGPTSHCFADGTHQTCCMLGPQARAYADRSGNPIGKAAERAFREANNRNPNQDELTPWCTCFGSKVCSYYAEKFNDGTHIKFVNNPNNNEIVENIPSNCEGYFRNKFSISTHGTPGVDEIEHDNDGCQSISTTYL